MLVKAKARDFCITPRALKSTNQEPSRDGDPPERVLIVDDERDMAESCAFFLERAGFATVVAVSGDEALAALDRSAFDLVVTDLRMPRMTGLSLLDVVKSRDQDVEVLLITGYPEIDTAVEAIKRGASDYVAKPFTEDEFMARVERALAQRRVKKTNAAYRERLAKGERGVELIGSSPEFLAAIEMVERAARSDASILLQGESGTGKELLAHHLHRASPRANKPFVPVDCTTIPAPLFESELFGHVKGAFTGAHANKLGLFQAADGGTLFLDEVGELPAEFQPKLLRVIQERQIRRVGGNAQLDVDARIVCATNRNLQTEVDEGRFREDLFYRLNVVRIDVPPLRDRAGCIEPLVRHFLQEFGVVNGRKIEDVDPAAWAALRAFPWPGNVRQLRNVLERAVALEAGNTLHLDDLPVELRSDELHAEDTELSGTFQEMKARKVAAIERSYAEKLLRKHGGNVTHSAEEAGMARSAFQKLMTRHGIRSQAFR